MIISFFEEFPTKNNLEKLKLVTWPSKLYVAAKSIKGFKRIKSYINNPSINHQYIQEIIYWPTLEKKEGYWISPFSNRTALQRVFSEVKNIPVMLDLELPTRHNPWLYLTQLFNFYRNKKMIQQFIRNHPKEVYLAEYYPCSKLKEKFLELLGLHYAIKDQSNSKKVKIIKMAYHSLHHFQKEKFSQLLKEGKREFKDNYLVAFGTIAIGIDNNEPLLSLKQLQEDLTIAQKIGIKEVIIFRLGGLNKSYVRIFQRYLTK